MNKRKKSLDEFIRKRAKKVGKFDEKPMNEKRQELLDFLLTVRNA